MENLGDKLRSLGVRLGKEVTHIPTPRPHRTEISEIVDGEIIDNNWGETFLVMEHYPLDMLHGSHSMFHDFDRDMLFRWAKMENTPAIRIEDMIFIDTETTGLAGGTGTMAFMVGIGFYGENNFHLYQYFLRTPDEERAMLAAIVELVNGFQCAVSYNGKAFDIPLLNSRFILNGMDSPFKFMQQLDLLHLARRLWKNRLASRTLGSIEHEILNFSRSQEEVPGWMAPELYYDYLKNGNAEGVAPVFYHNAMDIITLGALLMYVGKLLSEPLQLKELPGLDLIAIGRLYAEMGEITQAIELFENGMSRGLPNEFYIDCLLRQGEIYKKSGEIIHALSYWEKAVKQGSVIACEELAKYHEHQSREYETAMSFVNQGLEIIAKMPGNTYQKHEMDRNFQHRLERLLGKWQKAKVE